MIAFIVLAVLLGLLSMAGVWEKSPHLPTPRVFRALRVATLAAVLRLAPKRPARYARLTRIQKGVMSHSYISIW